MKNDCFIQFVRFPGFVTLCGEHFKSCRVDLTSRSGICSPGPRRQSPIGERAEREYKSNRGASKCKHARYCTLETRLPLNVRLERTSNFAAWFGCQLQAANPDVAVADWVIMILQRERQFFRCGRVRRPRVMRGRSGQLDIVLHQRSIVKNRYARRATQFSAGIESRTVKNNIVSLPLPRRPRRIHQWWILSVDGCGLTVGVGLALVGIEHLNFV